MVSLSTLIALVPLLLSTASQDAAAHTWLDCLDLDRLIVYDQSALYIFGGTKGQRCCHGHGAGFPGRGASDIGTAYTYKMLRNEVAAGTPVCQNFGANAYSDWRTRLSVTPGQTAFFSYLPNGHIVKDKKAIGTQHGVYWTGKVGTALTSTLQMKPENLLNGHTMNFDDGNCGESLDNEGKPSGRAGDGKPCVGSFTIPAGTPPGVYHMVWYWTFWLDDETAYVDQAQARGYFGAAYSTCFEVEVLPVGAGVAAPVARAPVVPAPVVAPVPAAPAPVAAAPIVAATPPGVAAAEARTTFAFPALTPLSDAKDGGIVTQEEASKTKMETLNADDSDEESLGPGLPKKYGFESLTTEDPASKSSGAPKRSLKSTSDVEEGGMVTQDETPKTKMGLVVDAEDVSGKEAIELGSVDADGLPLSEDDYESVPAKDSASKSSGDLTSSLKSMSSTSGAEDGGMVKQVEIPETEVETPLDAGVSGEESTELGLADADGSESQTTEETVNQSSEDLNSSLESTSFPSDAEEGSPVTQEDTSKTEMETPFDADESDEESTDPDPVDIDGLLLKKYGFESLTPENSASGSSEDPSSSLESTTSTSDAEDGEMATQEETEMESSSDAEDGEMATQEETEMELPSDAEDSDEESTELGSLDADSLSHSKDDYGSLATEDSTNQSSEDPNGSLDSMNPTLDAEKDGYVRQEETISMGGSTSTSSGSSSGSSGNAVKVKQRSSANSITGPNWWLILGAAVLVGTTK
uniref:Uncharacterized protein n=1 Tax=Peronospora matthiolae TaxID=2874970 RepID=A0AAV1TCD8_9STRA